MNDKRAVVIVRGAIMATVFVTLWALLATLVRRFDAVIGAVPPAWLQPAGWLIGALGAVIGVSSVFLFLTEGRGTPAPFDPPKVFVASGPYRYVRNPMYVGGVFMLLGAGLIVRSISIVILGVVFWGLAHLMVVAHEEPALEKRFGESFTAYTRQTNRWLPGLPRRARV